MKVTIYVYIYLGHFLLQFKHFYLYLLYFQLNFTIYIYIFHLLFQFYLNFTVDIYIHVHICQIFNYIFKFIEITLEYLHPHLLLHFYLNFTVYIHICRIYSMLYSNLLRQKIHKDKMKNLDRKEKFERLFSSSAFFFLNKFYCIIKALVKFLYIYIYIYLGHFLSNSNIFLHSHLLLHFKS